MLVLAIKVLAVVVLVVVVMMIEVVLPVIFLQSCLICWRAWLNTTNKLARFVFLLIKIEPIARVVLTFHHPTLSEL